MVKNRLVDIEIDNGSHAIRNTIYTNVMVLPECMEERGNCHSRICNEIKALEGYKDELRPSFNSTPVQFQTVILASLIYSNVGDYDGDMSEAKLTEHQCEMLDFIKRVAANYHQKDIREFFSESTHFRTRPLCN